MVSAPGSWYRAPEFLVSNKTNRSIFHSNICSLGDRDIFYSNEMTLCGLLDCGHQRSQAMTGSLEFPALPIHSLQRGEGLETKSVVTHVYVREPPKNPSSVGFRGLPLWLSGKESTCSAGGGFNPCIWKILWWRKSQPILVFLLG